MKVEEGHLAGENITFVATKRERRRKRLLPKSLRSIVKALACGRRRRNAIATGSGPRDR
ncbi:hypothetical protein JG688_00005417 [Phytophthora aleatoria]|uniref:Uncharacterized protein n=1 Tax=Phytophthora aleatoria TaxID=2496075 RepID=A0A8J5IPQ6_9STRA|nr:hypothetical protein JG688_00005417 [Phytophthora aleatoria]